METGVWLSFMLLFLAGGLTPGPAVMLVATSSIRYGFWASMLAAVGVCAANLVWIAIAVSGASALARAFPAGFVALKIVGIGFILFLAWKTAFGAPVDLTAARAAAAGQAVCDRRRPAAAQSQCAGLFRRRNAELHRRQPRSGHAGLVLMATVTLCEMFGLMVYALGADCLARRFLSETFARWFFRIAALAMAASALFAVFATWSPVGGQ